MKKTKRLFLTMTTLCMLLVSVIGSNGPIFAQTPDISHTFEETLNDDKTKSTITLNLIYDATKIKVDKIIQPDKSEILPQDNSPLVTSSYHVAENSSFDYEVKYTDLTSKEVKSEKFTSFEVKEIKKVDVPVIDEQEQPKEQATEMNKPDNLAGRGLSKPTAVGTEFVDDEEVGHLGQWHFRIIDESKKEVSLTQYRRLDNGLPATADPNVVDSEYFALFGGGQEGLKRYILPSTVLYNDNVYIVKEIGSMFTIGSAIPGAILSDMGAIVVPNTVTKIEGDIGWGNEQLQEIIIPDSVVEISGAFLSSYSTLHSGYKKIVLSNNASYLNSSFNGSATNLKELIFEEGKIERTSGVGFIVNVVGLETVSLPTNWKSIDEASFLELSDLKTLSLWNTTTTPIQDFSYNNPRAVYLIKSNKAMEGRGKKISA